MVPIGDPMSSLRQRGHTSKPRNQEGASLTIGCHFCISSLLTPFTQQPQLSHTADPFQMQFPHPLLPQDFSPILFIWPMSWSHVCKSIHTQRRDFPESDVSDGRMPLQKCPAFLGKCRFQIAINLGTCLRNMVSKGLERQEELQFRN